MDGMWDNDNFEPHYLLNLLSSRASAGCLGIHSMPIEGVSTEVVGVYEGHSTWVARKGRSPCQG